MRLVQLKRNFLKKVAFWAKAENELLRYGALEVHKQKVHARL